MATLAKAPAPLPPYVWLPGATADLQLDVHAGFRLVFTTAAPNTSVVVRHVAVSWCKCAG